MKKQIITTEERSKIYNFLYNFADGLWKKHNPCKFNKGKCLRENGCCSGCEYLTSEGYSTQALWCKLWTCHLVRVANPDFAEEMRALEDIARHYCLLRVRASKNEVLGV